jgi:hypothetical protein
MNRQKIKKLLSLLLKVIHIISLVLMVTVGLLSLFRPDLMREGIDWVGMHIKSWGDWNYVILLVTAMAESFPFVGAVLPGMNMMILVG